MVQSGREQVEPLLHHARDDAPQFVLRDRLRHGQRPHVFAHVEPSVVEPGRRDRTVPAPMCSLQRQPRRALDPVGNAEPGAPRHPVEVRALTGSRIAIFQGVARDRGGLEPEDLDVLRTERLHHRQGSLAKLGPVRGDALHTRRGYAARRASGILRLFRIRGPRSGATGACGGGALSRVASGSRFVKMRGPDDVAREASEPASLARTVRARHPRTAVVTQPIAELIELARRGA